MVCCTAACYPPAAVALLHTPHWAHYVIAAALFRRWRAEPALPASIANNTANGCVRRPQDALCVCCLRTGWVASWHACWRTFQSAAHLQQLVVLWAPVTAESRQQHI